MAIIIVDKYECEGRMYRRPYKSLSVIHQPRGTVSGCAIRISSATWRHGCFMEWQQLAPLPLGTPAARVDFNFIT